MEELGYVPAATTGYVEAESSGPDLVAARIFFALAIATVVGDWIWLSRTGLWPNYFALCSLFVSILALVALHFSGQLENERATGLPRSLAPAWSLSAVFFAFLAFYSITCSLQATGFNEPVRQSYAFLHGHAWVDNIPSNMEHVTWQGRTYLVHPPLPAILLMPIVAIKGLSTNQTAVSVVLGAFEVALAWRLLGVLGLTLNPRLWLTMFLALGTTLWYEVTIGNSWNFVLVVSVAMTLLVLNELFGAGRPWLLGFLTGLAGLARNDLAPLCPLYALILLLRGRRLRELAWMLPGWALAGFLYVMFNEVRYGTIFDITLWIYYPTDPAHLSTGHGPFSIHYLPANLYTLFFLGPGFDGRFPYIHPTLMGQALPLTSPAFVLALRPSFRRPIPALLALAAVIASLASLTCYASGYAQFGTRYYLQVYPLLLVLMALGMKHRVDQMAKILIVASMILVAFGVWQIRGLGIG
jgi:hypothetical protein